MMASFLQFVALAAVVLAGFTFAKPARQIWSRRSQTGRDHCWDRPAPESRRPNRWGITSFQSYECTVPEVMAVRKNFCLKKCLDDESAYVICDKVYAKRLIYRAMLKLSSRVAAETWASAEHPWCADLCEREVRCDQSGSGGRGVDVNTMSCSVAKRGLTSYPWQLLHGGRAQDFGIPTVQRCHYMEVKPCRICSSCNGATSLRHFHSGLKVNVNNFKTGAELCSPREETAATEPPTSTQELVTVTSTSAGRVNRNASEPSQASFSAEGPKTRSGEEQRSADESDSPRMDSFVCWNGRWYSGNWTSFGTVLTGCPTTYVVDYYRQKQQPIH